MNLALILSALNASRLHDPARATRRGWLRPTQARLGELAHNVYAEYSYEKSDRLFDG